MKNKLKNICIIIASAGLLSSCVNDTFDTPVQDACVSPGLTKTKTIADIYAIAKNPVATPPSVVPNTPTYHNYINPADPTKGENIDYIEAYVVSSDEGGNFYKSMYFQAVDGSKGFNLSVDEVNAYTKHFQPGKKVFLKLNGLAYANPTSFGVGLIFGAPPTEQYAVDRLSGLDYKNYLIPSCDVVSEDAIVHKITLAQAFSDTYLNTLIEIDNVQFTDEAAGGTYDSNLADDYDSSIYITDGGAKTLTIRTSRFANFAGSKVPTGKGKIRGVLTKYNSTYQIIMRTERDANMPNPRVDYTPALVGSNSTVFPGTVNETFESYAAALSNFPNYINDAFIGSRYWAVTSFGSNKYIQMTSFGSGGANNAYLFVPVNMTAANNVSFKSNMGYWNGAVLKVYYVLAADYTPGGKIDVTKMTNITSNFTIPATPASGYGAAFTASGNYAIPATVTGNGYFVFEYAGNANAFPAVTTTLQLDNILIN